MTWNGIYSEEVEKMYTNEKVKCIEKAICLLKKEGYNVSKKKVN